MSRRQLTQKQHAFLEYLQEHVGTHKVWPTYREIVDHFEYRSPNSVTQNLQALSRKGFLQRGRDGYALVEPPEKEGAIRVRGALRGGRLAPAEAGRLSLTTLFPDLTGLHALELDAETDRTHELGDASYVFVGEGDVPEGETVVVLGGNRLGLARIGPDGTLEADEPIEDAEVLGRYAGHAGPYGIVRPQTERVTA